MIPLPQGAKKTTSWKNEIKNVRLSNMIKGSKHLEVGV